jgi:hypothetical protein
LRSHGRNTLDRSTPCLTRHHHTLCRHGEQLILSARERGASTMAGRRDDRDAESDLVCKRFSGRDALRDRCCFEMTLQMGFRLSVRLSIRVGQGYPLGTVVDEPSSDRRPGKGGRAGKASGRPVPVFAPAKPHILAWLQRMASTLKVQDPKKVTITAQRGRSRHRSPRPRPEDGGQWPMNSPQAPLTSTCPLQCPAPSPARRGHACQVGGTCLHLPLQALGHPTLRDAVGAPPLRGLDR